MKKVDPVIVSMQRIIRGVPVQNKRKRVFFTTDNLYQNIGCSRAFSKKFWDAWTHMQSHAHDLIETLATSGHQKVWAPLKLLDASVQGSDAPQPPPMRCSQY